MNSFGKNNITYFEKMLVYVELNTLQQLQCNQLVLCIKCAYKLFPLPVHEQYTEAVLSKRTNKGKINGTNPNAQPLFWHNINPSNNISK